MVSEKLKHFLLKINEKLNQEKRINTKLTPTKARVDFASLCQFSGDKPEITYLSDFQIMVNNHSVLTRVYSSTPNKAQAVILYFHGGGHMCGDIALYDVICRKIALASHCIVISVNYRLAPEFPYPAGIDDAQLVLENYKQALMGLNANSQLYIAGDSAGGAICASLVMNNCHNDNIKINKQILIYPSLDYTLSSPSLHSYSSGYLLETNKIAWYFNHYFQKNEDRKALSPLFGPIHHNFPQTLIITAEHDPLKDEALAYAKKLRENKVPVKHIQFDHMVHAFMNLEDLVETECNQVYGHIATYLNGS